MSVTWMVLVLWSTTAERRHPVSVTPAGIMGPWGSGLWVAPAPLRWVLQHPVCTCACLRLPATAWFLRGQQYGICLTDVP